MLDLHAHFRFDVIKFKMRSKLLGKRNAISSRNAWPVADFSRSCHFAAELLSDNFKIEAAPNSIYSGSCRRRGTTDNDQIVYHKSV